MRISPRNAENRSVDSNIKVDANLEISIPEDGMAAYANLYPAFGGGEELRLEQVQEVLKEEGVVYGVKEDALKEALDRCNRNHHRLDHILIAQGREPETGISSHLKLRRRFFNKHHKRADLSILKVDYKAESPFILVKEGERIGRRVEAKPGKPGMTVRGEEIPAEEREMVDFIPGKNVVEKQGQLLAGCPGHFTLQDNTFGVSQVLQLEGNVDYHTGHISFPGDVIIPGLIKDGFRVAAGGSVFCKETLDASEVLARGDLIIDQGIIGRKTGLVRVVGRVESQFIENCTVEAKGGVHVVSSIVNSRILSLGRVDMGESSRILGGEIVAEQGLSVQDLGSDSSPAAVIKAGYSFVEGRRLESLKQRQGVLRKKIEKVNRIIRYRSGRDVQRLKEQMEASLEELGSQMEAVMGRLYSGEGAEVVVNGRTAAGSVIEICHTSYLVKEPLEHVRFVLNKASGTVEPRGIEDSPKE